MKIIKYFGLIVLSIQFGCKSASTTTDNENKTTNLNELMSIMQGNYSSEAQSKKDTTYYNISLRMVPIWKEKGNYLYVEQAVFNKQEKPYRVRIYKISQVDNNNFISEISTIKKEKDWYGKWKTPVEFDKLSEKDIEFKQGCAVFLKRISKNKFVGSTGDKSCLSDFGGAKYASSKVTITDKTLISWDQGFDKDNKQVWGAEKGGYEFVKY